MLRASVVDSWFDDRGVNCQVQIVSGELKEGDRISILPPGNDGEKARASQVQAFPVQEVGLLLPQTHRVGRLGRGQMGYVRFGLRDPRQAMPGTVLVRNKDASKKFIVPQIPKISNTKVSSTVKGSSQTPQKSAQHCPRWISHTHVHSFLSTMQK